MTKIAIIGAGITGLSLAWYLQKFYENGSITLFEKESRSGGMIETATFPFFFEKGPRTFSAKRCTELLELIYEVGLKEEILFSDRSAHKRWVYEKGAFKSPIPVWLGVKVLLADLFYKAPYSCEDLSVSEFFFRRYGKEFVERCVDPMISGIYASDVNFLSMEMAFPSLWEIQKRYGSLLVGMKKSSKNKGPSGLFTLRKGLGVLTQRLSEKLDIIYGATPQILEGGRVIENKEELFEFDHVFVTCDPKPLFKEEIAPISVIYNPLITVNCGYESQGFSKKGFGYLIPSKEKEAILGCVFDSMIFPDQNKREKELRLTLMIGGAHCKEILNKTDLEIFEIAKNVIRKHLGLSLPDFMKISRYEKAIASYPVGFANEKKRWVELMQESYPSLHFIWNGLGDPAVNGRVRVAKECALAFCRS